MSELRRGCAVSECARPLYAKGLCNLHWGRLRRNGNPLTVRPGNVKHSHAAGGTRTHEYRCWEAMKRRCLNPRATQFAYYGGRGIRIFGPWVHSFAAFLAAVGPSPSPAHTIERRTMATTSLATCAGRPRNNRLAIVGRRCRDPRMATPRTGSAYIWSTWLAQLLGGKECVWRVWFMSHFKYEKVVEEEAFDLVAWNREHSRLMRDRTLELEEAGWTVSTEDANAFKLQGSTATLAGKPDIVATMPGHVLVIDGKTGRARESDVWQVLIYLFALPKSRPDLIGQLVGEIQYKHGDKRVAVLPEQLTSDRLQAMVTTIKTISGPTPPRRSPSRDECKRCNIGLADCPERFQERAGLAAVLASEF